MTATLTPQPHSSVSEAETTVRRVVQSSDSVAAKLTFKQEVKIFTSTFFAVLLAELGDKTQMATLLMSAQSQTPWIVFLGAGTALISTSLLGVLVGRWLAKRVSAKTLETATGTILLLIAVMLFSDVVQL